VRRADPLVLSCDGARKLHLIQTPQELGAGDGRDVERRGASSVSGQRQDRVGIRMAGDPCGSDRRPLVQGTGLAAIGGGHAYTAATLAGRAVSRTAMAHP